MSKENFPPPPSPNLGARSYGLAALSLVALVVQEFVLWWFTVTVVLKSEGQIKKKKLQ